MSRNLTVLIGATTFHISKFDAFRQMEILGDLQKEVLPAAGGVLAAVFGAGDGGQGQDEQAMAQAINELSQRLSGESLKKWANVLLDAELISFELDGRAPQKLTSAHRGMAFEDFSEILELMFHILRHNFAGPFGRWAGHFGPVREKLGKLSGGLTPTSSAS
ncbi:phage tail assembly chaperone [Achromobacter insolitus]|uniref:phage tail assembly chaperone n=1 Tax=Achromobacter insolitus TaxID=217204 RepID=UPI0028AAC5B1|nr:hypothetical protein [Achromobacter insolitus]